MCERRVIRKQPNPERELNNRARPGEDFKAYRPLASTCVRAWRNW